MNALLAILIPALITVETGDRWHVVGAAGERGGLQITTACIEDVNRIYGTKFEQEDAHDPEKAKTICKLYLRHWGAKARLGRDATLEDLARLWNGGPAGYRKDSTVPYWLKVKKVLEGKR